METARSLQSRNLGWMPRFLLVILFGAAFGYVEAAVVVDLRTIYDPIRATYYPDIPADSLLPMLTIDQLREAGGAYVRRLIIELGRELTTMIMLVTVASLATRRKGDWIAMFMISFGVWDIAYYIGLKAMIDFPESLLSWDILFLVPVPWLGPVLAPVIVSFTMIAAGAAILAATGRGLEPRATWRHWAFIVLGGLIVIASFCEDFPSALAGEIPERYNWPLFAAGELIGIAAFLHALRRAYRTARLHDEK